MLYNSLDIKKIYTNYLKELKELMPLDDAMKELDGSSANYDDIGKRQVNILRYFGLKPHHKLIEVGCGSGRLAKRLSKYITSEGGYSCFDIVDEVVDYAAKTIQRPDWKFETIDYISIPEPDHSADMICFFSVLTHLLPEESYLYLTEAARVLKPGGKIVFSFLEFDEAHHGRMFFGLVKDVKEQRIKPISVYTNREDITLWAKHLLLNVEEFRDGSDLMFGSGDWESICVLTAPEITFNEASHVIQHEHLEPKRGFIKNFTLKLLPKGTKQNR